MIEPTVEAQIAGLTPDEFECYSRAVESLNEQIMKHAREVDRNFLKPFVVADIDAPENISKIVLRQFGSDWVFNVQVTKANEPEVLWMSRKYFDKDRRSAELKEVPKDA